MSLFVLKLMIFFSGLSASPAQLLTSYRVENVEALSSVADDGRLVLYAERTAKLRIFSDRRLAPNSQISFTNVAGAAGSDCTDLRKSDVFDVDAVDNNGTAVVSVVFSRSDAALDGHLMFCHRGQGQGAWVHQGSDAWMTLSLVLRDDQTEIVLLWVKSFLVPVVLFLSAVFSGLGLAALDLTRTELKVMRNQGGSEERRFAKVVGPLRKRGNVLYCGLLFLNTLANVAVVVLLYELVHLYSLLAATLLVFFLGELAPQAVCTRHGLAFGGKMARLTEAFHVIALPLSYPVGRIMDLLLDGDLPAVYNRDRLREVPARPERPGEADRPPPPAPTSAEDSKPFVPSNRTVGDVMVRLDEAYMEEYDGVLTADKISDILRRGFTRIPVYERERSNVVALLHVRDLALIDPKDGLTLKAVCKFYNRPVNFVFEDTRLSVMLEEFKKGQSHMAFVQRVNDEGPGDPYYETLGMITLEDVIEDIFHSDSSSAVPKPSPASVFDPQIHFQDSKISSDMERLKFNQYLALHRKENRGKHHHNHDRRHGDEKSRVENLPENLLLAVEHFLPTVLAFQPELISASVLHRLLRQGTVIGAEGGKDGSPVAPLVEKGHPMDFFLLVLEGKVKVTIGADDLEFMQGPFSHFGLPALLNALAEGGILPPRATAGDRTDYSPDFTVRPSGPEVLCLCLPLSAYLSSVQATRLQRMGRQAPSSTSDMSRGSRIGEEEDEAFVEANNVKNSFLNCSHHGPLSPGFLTDPFGGIGDYPGLPPEYPYRGSDDSWAAGALPFVPKESPSDEWLDVAAGKDRPADSGDAPVRPPGLEEGRGEGTPNGR